MNRFLASLSPWRQGYDWLGIVYSLVTGVLPLLHPACFAAVAEPGPWHAVWPHLFLHLLLAAFMFVVPPWLRSRRLFIARLLGVIYLPLLFALFYGELEFLGVVFRNYGDSFDPLLIDLERRLFGGQPSLAWSRAWPWPWLFEVMEFAYFSYYFFAIVALVLIWRTGAREPGRNWALSAALIRDLTAVMLSCYLWYMLFPVWGPKYFEYLGVAGSVASEGLRGWFFADIMHWIHTNGALHGAAFPSSHVAGSMVSWWWGWKVAPRHRWWLTTLWVMLGLSIVYCRYHYVVDLIGGIAWGAFVMGLAGRFMAMPADGLRRGAPDRA